MDIRSIAAGYESPHHGLPPCRNRMPLALQQSPHQLPPYHESPHHGLIMPPNPVYHGTTIESEREIFNSLFPEIYLIGNDETERSNFQELIAVDPNVGNCRFHFMQDKISDCNMHMNEIERNTKVMIENAKAMIE